MNPWGSPFLEAHASYRRYVGHASGAEVREADGFHAVRTGVRSDGQNGATSTRFDPAKAADLVAETIAWFRESKVPASWLCAETADALGSVLIAAGCKAETAAWEMRAQVAELDLGAAPHEAAEVRRVLSERELGGWLAVAAECEWFDDERDKQTSCRLYADLVFAENAPLRLYLALEHGLPVGMAVAFFTESIVLLDSVAVRPFARRRGVGRSLALTRLRDARDRGCDVATLAPSPDGAKLYEALGFERHPGPPNRWFYLPSS